MSRERSVGPKRIGRIVQRWRAAGIDTEKMVRGGMAGIESVCPGPALVMVHVKDRVGGLSMTGLAPEALSGSHVPDARCCQAPVKASANKQRVRPWREGGVFCFSREL